MDEQKNGDKAAQASLSCQCAWCRRKEMWRGCHGGWGWFVLKLCIALIILAVVFAIGVKIGELRSARFAGRYDFGNYHHYRMMRPGGSGYGGWGYYGSPYSQPVQNQGTAPAPSANQKTTLPSGTPVQ